MSAYIFQWKNILLQKREEVKLTYPARKEVRYCKYCKEPLKYGTEEYENRAHKDTCFQ